MATRWTGKDTEVFEMYAPGTDGKEAKMMEQEARAITSHAVTVLLLWERRQSR